MGLNNVRQNKTFRTMPDYFRGDTAARLRLADTDLIIEGREGILRSTAKR